LFSVDDVHLLPDTLLVDLNGEMDLTTPLGLILAGQPQLRARPKELIHEALDQRTLPRCSLAGLSRQEIDTFVAAHLDALSSDSAVFKKEARDVAYRLAKGMPRALNNVLVWAICTQAGERRSSLR